VRTCSRRYADDVDDRPSIVVFVAPISLRCDRDLNGTSFAPRISRRTAMSLVRLLGFTTLACGCVVGRYREVATSREVSYVEEKGKSCGSHAHRRNHPVAAARFSAGHAVALVGRAS